MRYLAICVVALVALSFGCAEMVVQGRAIDRAKIDQLVPGQTESGKVVEMFGKPDSVEKMAGGGEKYVYQYYQLKPRLFRVDEVVKQRLDINIQDDRVQGYNLMAESTKDLPADKTQGTK